MSGARVGVIISTASWARMLVSFCGRRDALGSAVSLECKHSRLATASEMISRKGRPPRISHVVWTPEHGGVKTQSNRT